MSVEILRQTLAAIRPADRQAMADARAHQDRLTKPRGALGVLEEVAVRLAGVAGACPPPLPTPAALAIFAADHGVHAQGVSPWPQEVTTQMVTNFLAGGAVANAFAAQVGTSVTVVDVGVASGLPEAPGLVSRKVAFGTADLSRGPAMTPAQAVAAIEAGISVARDLIGAGAACLITGDMGIANTTASAALICAFTGADAAETTGRGTGADTATLSRKIEIVRRGLEVNGISTLPPGRAASPSETVDGAGPSGHGSPSETVDGAGASGHGSASETVDGAGPAGQGPAFGMADAAERVAHGSAAVDDALRRLAAVGGLEHAAIAGFVLGAAAAGVPVILDGVIAGSAALAAAALAPDAVDYCVAGHRSAEPGHAIALDHLGLRPLVDLELRLGEGTGALLAYPLVSAAVRVMHDVATFDSAGVTDKDAQAGLDAV
ncbi:nicotinate-nucleotide--dimethylbenzimidazole phosphoribosyltransferase [Sphaerisporangium sp. NPDC088356]|uniref:nicotinate-nucleotide--dimethylbenzimidazole phosphoribosyltransferase n=1 Tax=Sphaerisporangium sp. NPDC088356 TaxID=3154871 RepID=UPI003418C91E